jgi:peptide/nickel transport system permease protein
MSSETAVQFLKWFTEHLSRATRILEIILANDFAKVGMGILLVFTFMALFSPLVAPNDPYERAKTPDGEWMKNQPPSLDYPLGTTSQAYPIFSRLVYGTHVAFTAGLLTAVIVGVVGTFAGITAGYFGGYTENIIMRLVDIAYGLPFLPFAIVLILLIGGGSVFSIILAISLILWRGTARVIRSEVLSIKEQPMIDAAKASGAGTPRILFYHIFPKVLPTAVLYSIFAIGWGIIAEAGLSFIGFGNPEAISWGTMLNNAYARNALLQDAWMWIFPPGICIVLFVLSAYMISQGIEEVVNPELREI